MTETKRLNLTITKPQSDYLRREAARLGLSLADLIRRIIDAHREKPVRSK